LKLIHVLIFSVKCFEDHVMEMFKGLIAAVNFPNLVPVISRQI
jgi:hypothetical protein